MIDGVEPCRKCRPVAAAPGAHRIPASRSRRLHYSRAPCRWLLPNDHRLPRLQPASARTSRKQPIDVPAGSVGRRAGDRSPGSAHALASPEGDAQAGHAVRPRSRAGSPPHASAVAEPEVAAMTFGFALLINSTTKRGSRPSGRAGQRPTSRPSIGGHEVRLAPRA